MSAVPLDAVTEYLRPATVPEAYAALRDGGVLAAGGTNLILHGPDGPAAIVDLDLLPLRYVRDHEGGLAVGATATLTEFMEHPGVGLHLGGVLHEMLRHIGSPLLRNLATVGGHLARGRLSDMVPTLLALDAEVTVHDGSDRDLSLADYYTGAVHTTTHLLTEVRLPAAAPRSAGAFLKFSRTYYDLAILNAACRVDLDGETVAACRVVVGETPALGASVPEAEAALTGRAFDDEAIAAAAEAAAGAVPTGSDSRASAEYRAALVAPVVRRCLGTVRERIGGGS